MNFFEIILKIAEDIEEVLNNVHDTDYDWAKGIVERLRTAVHSYQAAQKDMLEEMAYRERTVMRSIADEQEMRLAPNPKETPAQKEFTADPKY